MKYILGYTDEMAEKLTLFDTVKQANYEAEEWVKIEANSREEAENKYEEAFLNWQKENN